MTPGTWRELRDQLLVSISPPSEKVISAVGEQALADVH